MSGGSHNYLYSTLAIELDIPSGSYGIGKGKYDSYVEDAKEARIINPMQDADLSELMYDVSCLLHSLEWYRSGDTGEEQYNADKKAFKDKWFNRNNSESKEIAYKNDLADLLRKMLSEIKE